MKDIFKFFETPPDDTVVWRYRKFGRLKDLLINKALHFTSAALLRDLDPLEGELPQSALSKWNQHDEVAKRILKQYRRSIHCFHVNCWTLKESENERMWREYTCDGNKNYDRGVVIKSTFKKLKEAFIDFTNDKFNWSHQKLYFGKVRYTDHAGVTDFDRIYDYYRDFENISNVEGLQWTDVALEDMDSELVIDAFPTLPPIIYKDNEYSWEKELRIITLPFSTEEAAEASNGASDISVDLKSLIESISISPTSKPEFLKEVEDLVQKFNLDVKVDQSFFAINK